MIRHGESINRNRQTLDLVIDARTQLTEGGFKPLDFKVNFAGNEIDGRVVDESGQPMVGAIVRADPKVTLFGDSRKQAYGTTDEYGVFRWSGFSNQKLRPIVIFRGKLFLPKVTIQPGKEIVEIVVRANDEAP